MIPHLILLILSSSSWLTLPHPIAAPLPDYQSLHNCFSLHTNNISQLLYTPNATTFPSLLHSSIRNLRFDGPATRKPVLIVTPSTYSHVQASVVCCRSHGIPIRTRSGGHDYEGLSYRAENNVPFAIVDFVNLRSVTIEAARNAAWVEAGATLGELYYRIAEKSPVHGFPAGICPTVGIGGHVSGGGFGTMLRKYGLASDNVVDAKLVDADGKLLDRESMGEDLFWAIRGGGGGSFGIVVSFKVNLVPVPSTVSVFSIHKTLGQGATYLINKWQIIAHQLIEDLFIRIVIQRNSEGNKVEALFNSLFLGDCNELVRVMDESFPELRLERNQCKQMSWVESVMYFAGYTDGQRLDILLDRGAPYRFFKAKSDFVKEPIPGFVWERIWTRFLEDGAGVLIMDPYGGKMVSVSDSETPFPHREGVLYNMQYFVEWTDGEESRKRMDWIRRLYGEMTPYVSKNPRASYANYRDLDLGINGEDGNVTSYSKAEVWGVMYFKSNFQRLAMVKRSVDPSDFFRNEQSIPPLCEGGRELDHSELMAKSQFKKDRRPVWLSYLLDTIIFGAQSYVQNSSLAQWNQNLSLILD